jgi:hypothetical protein
VKTTDCKKVTTVMLYTLVGARKLKPSEIPKRRNYPMQLCLIQWEKADDQRTADSVVQERLEQVAWCSPMKDGNACSTCLSGACKRQGGILNFSTSI